MRETQENSTGQPSSLFERVKLVLKLGWAAIAAYARLWNDKLGFKIGPMGYRVPATWIISETFACLLPYVLGIQFYIVVSQKRWFVAGMVGLSAGFFLGTTILRNLAERGMVRFLRGLVEHQSTLARAILNYNDKLVQVALVAEVVKATIEAGYEPDIQALSRSLAALYPESSARVN